MAEIKILGSRRCAHNTSKFDIEVINGEIAFGDIFSFKDSAGPFEFVIQSFVPIEKGFRLSCLNWLLYEGQFVGEVVSTRMMNHTERKRYQKLLDSAYP